MATVRREAAATPTGPATMFVLIFAAMVVLAYIGALIWLAWQSLQLATEPVSPELMTLVVGGVGGALATNFGIVLGISMEQGKERKVTNLFGAAAADVNPWAKVAAVLYAGVLIVAPIVWFVDGMFSPETAEAIRTLSRTFVGVGIACLGVVLGPKK